MSTPHSPPRTSLLSALAELPENAIARREWRALGHQSRDWRLWLGLRLPKDARGWGLPAIVWCAVIPYALWGIARIAIPWVEKQVGPLSTAQALGIPDALMLCCSLVGLYLALISVALMATAVTREREQETWESLRTTAASSDDILLGLLAGRLGPPLLGFLLVGVFWVATLGHTTELLSRYLPTRMDGPALGWLVLESVLMALSLGLVATAISTRCRRSGVAVVASTGASILLLLGAFGTYAVQGFTGAPILVLVLCAVVSGAAYAIARRELER